MVGIFIHGLLDQNPTIINSITKSFSINAVDLEEIRRANAKLKDRIKNEIGISTNIPTKTAQPEKRQSMLLVTAKESGSGKTFLLAGIAGALKREDSK